MFYEVYLWKQDSDRKLVRRSTRTSDLEEAKRVAEEIYEELRYKHLNQKSLTAVTFKYVAADFVKKAAPMGAAFFMEEGAI